MICIRMPSSAHNLESPRNHGCLTGLRSVEYFTQAIRQTIAVFNYPIAYAVAEYLHICLLQTALMTRILLGDRNPGHRRILKNIFEQLDSLLRLDFAGNGHDILLYLANRPPDDLPKLIILDPAIPFVGQGDLIGLLKSNQRLSHIPVIIWTDQPGSDYYLARASGHAAMSFLKPSLPGGWELLAQKMLLALDMDRSSSELDGKDLGRIDIPPH